MTLHTVLQNTIENGSDNFYISHNKYSSAYGCQTTALVLKKPLLFLVLEGDHREGTKDFKSFNECIEYYKKHYDQSNQNSESKFLIGSYDYLDKDKLIQTLGSDVFSNFTDFLLSRN